VELELAAAILDGEDSLAINKTMELHLIVLELQIAMAEEIALEPINANALLDILDPLAINQLVLSETIVQVMELALTSMFVLVMHHGVVPIAIFLQMKQVLVLDPKQLEANLEEAMSLLLRGPSEELPQLL